jgi:hypothetical protein
VALEQGDYAAAGKFLRDAFSIRHERGDKMGIAELLEEQTALIGAMGNAFRAAHIGGSAERLREEIGSPLETEQRLRHKRHMAGARAALGNAAAFNRAWVEGRVMSPEQAIEISFDAAVARG